MLVNMSVGNYSIPVNLTAEKGRIFLQFPFNRKLLEEVKNMSGRRWHGYDEPKPRKVWSVLDNARNRFQLAYLIGHNPYERYDRELIKTPPKRDILMQHQINMFQHQITRIQAIISGEMGVGKTLSMIEALEYSGYRSIIWVGTGSSIAAVRLEFRKWKSELIKDVLFLNYHSFRDLVKKNELYVPEALVFDECQKLKGHNTIQSQMANKLTEAMRVKLKDEAFIGLMSGAPAPNCPPDWWNQCEVACPGYIKEGDWYKFQERLALMGEGTSASNQVFKKVITWLDDENKCATCGKFNTDHDEMTGHPWVKSVNEVEYLYKRMQGLNVVHFKKDCLELPELQFKIINLEPTVLIKKAAQMIVDTTPRTITALMKLRELSDGFQYKETETGETETCPLCKGSGIYIDYYDPEHPDEWPSEEAIASGRCKSKHIECHHCEGLKTVPKMQRTAYMIPCPKDQLVIDLLEEHEDIGRFAIYAGFQASIDRTISIALQERWSVIRADGRGWLFINGQTDPELGVGDKGVISRGMDKERMLERFQSPKSFTDKIVFVGQGGAAGTGITLTATPTIFVYSNTFNADDRIQLINRIHRPGMDVNRGATIIDCIHLDTDQYVLDNLNKKLNLLALSMGKFRKAVKDVKRATDVIEYDGCR